MLTVTVRFLHGVVRASGYEDLAVAGDASVEWPPSPARLLSAFVAADGTRDRSGVTREIAGAELRLMEGAQAPVIHASESADVVSSKLNSRFVVLPSAARGITQNYPGKVALPVRPGVRLALRNPEVTYVWADLDVTDGIYEALRLRAARIGYLGCSDSPVRVTVGRRHPEMEQNTAWRPSEDGEALVSVPYEGMVNDLDNLFDRFVSGGEQPRRNSLTPELKAYRTPTQPVLSEKSKKIFWLTFNRSIAGHQIRIVTETLRNAVLDSYERHVAGDRSRVPEVLHGHGDPERGHAQWLALPNVGYRYSDGRIHGAALVLPTDIDIEVVAGINTALHFLRQLTAKSGAFSVELRRWDGSTDVVAVTPRRWTSKSHRWISVTPVIHETFQRRGVDLATLAKWCAIAGLPSPIAFRESEFPLASGALRLRSNQVRRKEDRRPFSHFEIIFDEPINGPVVIGSGRHFGLGLFAPVRDGL